MSDEALQPPPPASTEELPVPSSEPVPMAPPPPDLGQTLIAAAVAAETETKTEMEPPPPPAEVATTTTTREAASEAELPPTKPAPTQEVFVVQSEKGKSDSSRTFIQSAVSFKEESNIVSDLSDFERKSLEELRKLVQEALNNRTLLPPPPPLPKQTKQEASTSQEEKVTTIEFALKEEQTYTEVSHQTPSEDVSIWGIPLLKDDRTDVILLKFLRAREFRVNDAFVMINNTLKWRRDFGIDRLVEEDLGDDLDKVVFMHGHDREGHPVCYNVYGEFQNKELYTKTFSDGEKRARFLRWRIQFLERSIRKLDFSPGGVNTIFQVNDLKNAPGPAKRELRQATRQALHLLQDNYPEFVAKQVFINVPWWHVAFYTMMSPFMTQRTKSKFVFTGPSKTAETLFKYISPEKVPIQYGGLSVDYCDCNPEFTVDDAATEINIKPTTKQFVEILVSEKCIIVWELRVVGWEVTYNAEFVPSSNDSYTVIIQKATKMGPNDDPVISSSYKISELGKIVLTVDNPTFKRRKLLYRYKVLPFTD
ncbi:Patellin-3 [Ancistrocladus abbreviatus]